MAEISKKLINEVYFSNGDCMCMANCGQPLLKDENGENWVQGHVEADSQGGFATLANIVPICNKCNTEMFTKNMVEWMREENRGDFRIRAYIAQEGMFVYPHEIISLTELNNMMEEETLSPNSRIMCLSSGINCGKKLNDKLNAIKNLINCEIPDKDVFRQGTRNHLENYWRFLNEFPINHVFGSAEYYNAM